MTRRQSGWVAGLGLLVTLVVVLLLGLRLFRGGEHPLAQKASFDLCERLGDVAWTVLDSRYHAPTPGETVAALGAGGHAVADSRAHPQSDPTGDPNCRLFVQGPDRPHEEPADVNVFVVTAASLRRRSGFRGSIDRYFDTFAEEARASGSSAVPLEGPWKEASLIRDRSGALQVLAQDDGVMISIIARGFEAPEVTAFASAVARRLR